MQQTVPSPQAPLGRPPIETQRLDGTQEPVKPFPSSQGLNLDDRPLLLTKLGLGIFVCGRAASNCATGFTALLMLDRPKGFCREEM